MTILGIETSCDETAAAVVKGGRDVLSSIVATQIPLHAPYGGVVPEIASRSHVENIGSTIKEALAAARCHWNDLDAVAATYGPGLASSLLIGLSAAKSLAWTLQLPFIGVNHIEAHIYSVFLSPEAPEIETVLPLLALVVSGGHTALVKMDENRDCTVLGQTLDDAAGEAFDKGAKLIGLGYPGGPQIEKAARRAQPSTPGPIFPQGKIGPDNPALGSMQAELCFSFSGLKTSLLNHIKQNPITSDSHRDELALAYQDAIISALVDRCRLALESTDYQALAVGGGVSLNAVLRTRLKEIAKTAEIPLLLPEARFCGDNAAMIAGLAGHGGGVRGKAAFQLDAAPGLGWGR